MTVRSREERRTVEERWQRSRGERREERGERSRVREVQGKAGEI